MTRHLSGTGPGGGGPRNTGHGEVPLAKDERSPERFGLIRTLADDGRVLAWKKGRNQRDGRVRPIGDVGQENVSTINAPR